MVTADEIVAAVQAQPTATFAPAVRVLVEEIVRLRAALLDTGLPSAVGAIDNEPVDGDAPYA